LGEKKNPVIYWKSILIGIKLSMITEVWIPIVRSKEPDLAPVTKKSKLTKIRIP
jgi:hypothetical protein